MQSPTSAQDSAAAPKHRACDECRKCPAQSLEAIYPAQRLIDRQDLENLLAQRSPTVAPVKPMGRPRKRRHIEDDAPVVAHNMPVPTGLTNTQGFHEQTCIDPLPTSIGVDQNFGFLDEPAATNHEFWNSLPNNYLDTLPVDPYILHYDASSAGGAIMVPQLSLSGIDLLGNINFDEPDLAQENVSKDLSDSLQRYMAEQLVLPQVNQRNAADASTPVDSTLGSDHGTSVGSPDESAVTPPLLRSVPSVTCGCLSSLYLALDSLTRLPNEVIPAMRVARNASKVAHDVIECSVCSAPLLEEPTKPPPIQSFQNLMFLGALVPSACNAYATILEMVDAETALAKKQDRNFWFAFKDIGGLWGRISETASTCPVVQNYNNKSMAPDMWRLTLRGILRLDIYGLDESDSGRPKDQRYKQLGLKDVVDTLDERSRRRHEILDALVAAGQYDEGATGVIYPPKPCTPEQRTCLKVLETARIALNNLVIA
ncbi:hypothetical protein FZEAL_9642 [Fusarium zealandicum]|uniref:Uncharacterized protein n=1 Tax=Fusarium zealandicum TaxID=1053134 RepID=A0A8H4U9A7_9HYPO|nr:hypothetical protein FZEAL_9642 [Fusarium zealandicum]